MVVRALTAGARVSKRTIAELRLRRDAVGYFRRQGFEIGAGCRLIAPRYGMFGSEPTLVTIGHGVVISVDVLFITHDGGVLVLREEVGPVDVFGRISVQDGAFVGARAVLLPGVTIGRRSVVGAGAVVTRSVPDGVVVAGSPARVVSSLEDYRDRLRPYFHLIADQPMAMKHDYLRSLDESTLLRRPYMRPHREDLGGS